MVDRKIAGIAFWIGYLVVVFTLSYMYGLTTATKVFWNELAQMGPKILASSLTLSWVRALDPQKPLWLAAVKILVLILAVAVLDYTLSKLILYYPHANLCMPKFYKISGLVTFIFDVAAIVFLWTLLNILSDQFKAKILAAELAQEKLSSELSVLKSQINPHLYFNTLNNVYALALEKSDRTADMLLKLSNLMRYMLYECSDPQVPLSKEIKVIKDYIELEKIRYNERLNLSYNEEIERHDIPISPLMFLPVIENCFKHGSSNQLAEAQIDISIRQKKDELWLETFNTRDPSLIVSSNEKGGIGLRNLRRQLDLLYPGKHRLNIEESDHTYFFQLWLNLS
jgi:two-component system, LytTR family, sensor kinase